VAPMNTMLEYVVYRTTGLEYIFQLLLPKMSVEANVRRFLRHSLVCATRLWGTLAKESTMPGHVEEEHVDIVRSRCEVKVS
jgi:hypothetical protein